MKDGLHIGFFFSSHVRALLCSTFKSFIGPRQMKTTNGGKSLRKFIKFIYDNQLNRLPRMIMF